MAALNKAKDQRKQDFKVGKGNVSGREMFEFNPDLVVDMADADDGDENFDLSQFRSSAEEVSSAKVILSTLWLQAMLRCNVYQPNAFSCRSSVRCENTPVFNFV